MLSSEKYQNIVECLQYIVPPPDKKLSYWTLIKRLSRLLSKEVETPENSLYQHPNYIPFYFFNSFYLFFSLSYNKFQPHLPFLHSSHQSTTTFPILQRHCSLGSPQKREGLPKISTKHGITRCSNTRHKSSYQSWTRQPSRSKRVPKASKRDKATSIPIFRSTHKMKKLNNHRT